MSPVEDNLELTFVGTATTVLRYAGTTLLTDPNFLHAGEHAYLGLGLRSRRLTDPALEIDQLPPLDAVVLSHHHGDHFDHVAAERLDKDLPILTEPASAAKLRQQGFRRPVALPTWQRHDIERGNRRVEVTAMPAKHAPRPLAALLPSVMGAMLDYTEDGVRDLRVYITGDTLLHDRIHEIPRRYPDIDLCILHLGGTRIAGILLTMDADQGVRFLQIVRPATAVPVHYDDYTVFRSSLDEFRTAIAAEGVDSELRYVAHGDTVVVPVPPRP